MPSSAAVFLLHFRDWFVPFFVVVLRLFEAALLCVIFCMNEKSEVIILS